MTVLCLYCAMILSALSELCETPNATVFTTFPHFAMVCFQKHCKHHKWCVLMFVAANKHNSWQHLTLFLYINAMKQLLLDHRVFVLCWHPLHLILLPYFQRWRQRSHKTCWCRRQFYYWHENQPLCTTTPCCVSAYSQSSARVLQLKRIGT